MDMELVVKCETCQKKFIARTKTRSNLDAHDYFCPYCNAFVEVKNELFTQKKEKKVRLDKIKKREEKIAKDLDKHKDKDDKDKDKDK